MIISFSVENFRSIRNKICLDFRATADDHLEEHLVVEIPKPKLRILKMAMIYGANASGKTNILMALDFLRELTLSPLKDKNIHIDLPSFALDSSKPSTFEIEFYQKGVCYIYSVQLSKKRILQETLHHYPKGYKAHIYSRIYNYKLDKYEYKWTDRSYGKILREKLQLTIPNQTILSAISSVDDKGSIQIAHDWFRFNLTPFLGPVHDLSQFIYDSYDKNRCKKEFLLPILKKADFQIEDISYEKELEKFNDISVEELSELEGSIENINSEVFFNRYKLELKHKSDAGDYILKFRDESMGTQRFLGFSILLEMISKRDTCLPIDEIDSSLHLDLIEFFILLFFKYSKHSQLLFTSHNVALLNKKYLLRRDTVWITDRLPDGSTELTNVMDYPVRKEHAIDKLFMKGQIGGKPDIGVI
ncbi:MAG TPA: AAA family ATPase [Candidatus Cloacimonetes bacterium]|nr:AAA family ATPase [Candidatus Cloacimonadota bacterium]